MYELCTDAGTRFRTSGDAVHCQHHSLTYLCQVPTLLASRESLWLETQMASGAVEPTLEVDPVGMSAVQAWT
jgi:hypothetical protein